MMTRPDFSHENRHGHICGRKICGVDEVGRGPLAGPVIAAALIMTPALPQNVLLKIADSKALSPSLREELYSPLVHFCITSIGSASVEEIDRLNILQASLLAMRRAIEGLNTKPDMALIDGNRCPTMDCPAEAIIKGDAKSLSIAAASIIAKVTRDRLMTGLAQTCPGYGWERNFGYGTAEHLRALQSHGVTDWHRRSFAPVREASLLRSA